MEKKKKIILIVSLILIVIMLALSGMGLYFGLSSKVGGKEDLRVPSDDVIEEPEFEPYPEMDNDLINSLYVLDKIYQDNVLVGYSIVRPKSYNIKGNIVIPQSYKQEQLGVNLPILRIEKEAFAYCTQVTSVRLPNTIEVIEEKAFFNCQNLSAINLSNKLETIGESAFEKCYALTSITFPNLLTSIGGKAFFDCSNLFEITFGVGIRFFGPQAFYNCKKLDTIVFLEGIAWNNLILNYNTFDGHYDMTIFIYGIELDIIETALNKLKSMGSLQLINVKIDASLVGQITNTYGFASITSI